MNRFNFFGQKGVLVLLLGLLDGGILTAAILLPLKSTVNDIQALNTVKQDFLSLEKNQQDFGQIQQKLQERQADLDSLKDLFANRNLPVDFVSFLETSSRSSGFKIKITPLDLEAEKNDVWPSLVFQIKSDSGGQSLLAFLERLENSPYLLEIRDLNARRVLLAGQLAPARTVETTLTIKVFAKP